MSVTICCAAVLGVCIGRGSATSADPADPGMVGDGNLAAVLESIRVDHHLPALAAVLVRDGEVLEMAATGTRAIGHDEAVTVDDRWHIGSLTKAMTATLAAVLVERGTLSWDLTVGEALPELVSTIRPEYVDVRLDELLRHVAGMVEDVTRAPSWPTLRSDTTPMRQLRKRFAADLLALPPDGPTRYLPLLERGVHRGGRDDRGGHRRAVGGPHAARGVHSAGHDAHGLWGAGRGR